MKNFTFLKGIFPFILLVAFSATKLSAQTVSITSPSSGTAVKAGTPVTVSATRSASGTFGGSGNWTWTFATTPSAGVTYSVNPIVVGSGATQSTDITFANPGAYSVTVTVTRAGGGATAISPAITINVFTVNAGPDQLLGGTTAALIGTASGPGAITQQWSRISGPNTPTLTGGTTLTASLSGLIQGTYVYRLTLNGNSALADDITIRVITGTNLWATSSDGTQVSSFTVASGAYISGPTNIFAPTVAPGTSTAALGRTDKPTLNSGYFYWLPNDGTNGVVNIYGASAAGNNQTLVGTLDLNGGNTNNLGYVRLGMRSDGTGWLLARESTTNTIYLAKFTPNGVNPVTITIEDASVTLVGGTNSTFVNGDICLSGNGSLFALANNGSGVTQIFIGSPAGASTTLTKKWDLVDASNVPFTGTVNGVAFDALGALYISTGTGLFYINPATVNGGAGTVQCALTQAVTGLQDLASNVFPSTILLPIKLGAFTVTKQGNNALLNWTTVSEINADHFEIERSYDGINFTAVGTKQATGNSASDINYQFIDPISLSSGNIYYRLKTLDIDGKSSYSKIVVLRLNGGVVKNFTVYPNPFTSDLKLEINSDKETEITIRISNALGQPVINRTALLQKGTNVVVLSSELQNLKPGMHLMEIISEDGKLTQKIIKR